MDPLLTSQIHIMIFISQVSAIGSRYNLIMTAMLKYIIDGPLR
jgi:hypothetical protein